jgi:hypothetical protein
MPFTGQARRVVPAMRFRVFMVVGDQGCSRQLLISRSDQERSRSWNRFSGWSKSVLVEPNTQIWGKATKLKGQQQAAA